MIRTLLILLLVLSPVASRCAAAAPPDDALFDERAAVAVRRAADYLWSKQDRDGNWSDPALDATDPMAATALAAYTLRTSGVTMHDIRLQRSVERLKDLSDVHAIFTRSFSLLLWSTLDRKKYRRPFDENVQFLITQQHDAGGWGAGPKIGGDREKNRPDLSHSQLAILALCEASLAGADVPAGIWRRAEKGLLDSQNPDGGWGFPFGEPGGVAPGPRVSYGTMTAAGLASLHLLNDHLYADAEMAFNGRFATKCGQPQPKTEPMAKSLRAARTRLEADLFAPFAPFSPFAPFAPSTEAWETYYLYCLSRAALASGDRRVADRDWRREVVERLMATQQEDGSWGDLPRTCFGLLSLLHARAPLLIGKLRYGEGDGWNLDPRDAANLARWHGTQIERSFAWQAVGFEDAGRDLARAPVLLITGHTAPMLEGGQWAMLREYVSSGGTILAVACCSKKEFADGLLDALKEAMPSLKAGPLPAGHAVWSMPGAPTAGDDVIGLSDGCRTPIFVLNGGQCCAWQQNLTEEYARAFQLAGAILRYATHGMTQRLRPAVYLAETPVDAALRVMRVSRMEHGGDWQSDPLMEQRLSAALTARMGLGVRGDADVPAASGERGAADVVFITGHRFAAPEDRAAARLRQHVTEGGTVFAWACCGDAAFEAPFAEWAAGLLPGATWEAIPPDDPLLTGAFGDPFAATLHGLNIKPRGDGASAGRLDWPILRGIRHKDRWAVIYSAADVGCAIAGHPCYGCVGYEAQDATSLVGNVLLYAGR